jgi:hypothetical protein
VTADPNDRRGVAAWPAAVPARTSGDADGPSFLLCRLEAEARRSPLDYLRSTMHDALDKLCDDLGSDGLRGAIHALEIEAADNPHAAAMMSALAWIAAQDQRTPAERFGAIAELVSLPKGNIFIPSAREFFRWGALPD